MSLIRLHDITKHYDAKPVLRNIFFRLEQGDRVGLIGRNGTGKTTLLRLILGQEEPTQGQVQVDEGIRIGYFSQFSELHGDRSIETILDSLFTQVHALDAELKEIEKTLAADRDTRTVDSLLRRQAVLLERMNQIDGWHYQNRIDTVLTQLGFSQAHRTRPVEQLSGGWRNRAALAQILLQDPDVLLLDEPTNYLDIQGLTWLEQWLDKLRGALILVSHDRHFLDRVVNRIVEIENYQ
ncbi:MAG: ATP-binding cassette domain-containing protein, partial [bacterium]